MEHMYVRCTAHDGFIERHLPAQWFTNDLPGEIIHPISIKRRGTATLVKWRDGTETKVVLQQGKEDAGVFAAFCIALAKKLYGQKGALERAVNEADETRLRAQETKARALAKEMRQKEREAAMKKRQKAVARRIRREVCRWEGTCDIPSPGPAVNS